MDLSKKIIVGMLTGTNLLPLPSLSNVAYRVQNGDVLSTIAENKIGRPVYGRNGALQKVLAMNPNILDSNKIHPGEEILFSYAKAPRTPARTKSSAELKTGDRQLAAHEEQVPFNSAPSQVSDDSGSLANSSLRVGLGISYFKIEGKDLTNGGSARLFSNGNPAIDFVYTLNWTANTHVFLQGFLERYSFANLGSSQSFATESGARTRFGFGLDQEVASQLNLIFQLNCSQEYFLRAVSATVIGFDEAIVLEPSFKLRYGVFTKENADIGILAGGAFLLPSATNHYDIHFGTAYRAGIYFRNWSLPKKRNGVEASLSYDQQNQDSTIFSKKFSELRFALSYQWRIAFE